MGRAQRRRALVSIAAAAMAAALLAGCAATPPGTASAPAHIDIGLIAFNDLHGNLEPPRMALNVAAPDGSGQARVPAGGAAYMASAIAHLKAGHRHHAVVAAGDMVGASPLVSALFLDEPTIEAVNRMGIDFNAVGNHEFDKGWHELLRLKNGGCEKHTVREPCQLNPAFSGANFGLLAANTSHDDGRPLLPPTGIKRFTEGGMTISVGFIGLTLRGTPAMVAPAGVAGLRFADEADTVNALIPSLRAQGADVIVVMVHEGGETEAALGETSCKGLSGDILPILERLDPAVDVVVSGHTHRSYLCDYGSVNPAHPLLLTSAGQYGTHVTDISLRVDTATRRVVRKSARQVIVQGEGFTSGPTTFAVDPRFPVFARDEGVHAIVERYRAAAEPQAQRPAGRLSGPVSREPAASLETSMGNLIADAQLLAAQGPGLNAQISFMNPGGVRGALVPGPDGQVRYGQMFTAQPFGNSLMVQSFTGAQVKAILEQQFASATNTAQSPRVLSVSKGFSYRYDLRLPAGQRVSGISLDGQPLRAEAVYRVVVSSFLATGGDNFTVFTQGVEGLGAGQDLDALEAYFAASRGPVVPPATDRIVRVDLP